MTAIRFCPSSLTSRLEPELGVIRGQPPHRHLRGPLREGPPGLGDVLEVGHRVLVTVEQGVRPGGPEPDGRVLGLEVGAQGDVRVNESQFPGGPEGPSLQRRIIGTERRQEGRPRISPVDRRSGDPDPPQRRLVRSAAVP